MLALHSLVSSSGPMTSTPSIADIFLMRISRTDILPERRIHSSGYLHDISTCTSNRHLRFYRICHTRQFTDSIGLILHTHLHRCTLADTSRLANSTTIDLGIWVQILQPRLFSSPLVYKQILSTDSINLEFAYASSFTHRRYHCSPSHHCLSSGAAIISPNWSPNFNSPPLSTFFKVASH